jgi:hypothetical protein
MRALKRVIYVRNSEFASRKSRLRPNAVCRVGLGPHGLGEGGGGHAASPVRISSPAVLNAMPGRVARAIRSLCCSLRPSAHLIPFATPPPQANGCRPYGTIFVFRCAARLRSPCTKCPRAGLIDRSRHRSVPRSCRISCASESGAQRFATEGRAKRIFPKCVLSATVHNQNRPKRR